LRKKDTIKAEDIYRKAISKNISLSKNEVCKIILKDAMFAKVDGSEVLLDEIPLTSMVNSIAKAVKVNSTKYNPFPKSIIISQLEDEQIIAATDGSGIESNGIKANNQKRDDYLKIYEPRWTMDEVYIDQSAREQILSTLAIAKHRSKLFHEWGLKDTMKQGRSVVLNFYGPPGTGKSIMAEAIADYLGKKVYMINYSELESKYVGETPKNISSAFKRASENDAVLIFDEADSFLGKRLTNVSQSADYGINITRSVMLLEIERFDGVVIFTTNLPSNYDEAFKRRILANVEFKMPNKPGREKIWGVHIPKKLPLEKGISPEHLASKYDGITGADIKDMVLYASVNCLQDSREFVGQEDFDKAYDYIKNRYSPQQFQIRYDLITEEQYEKEMEELRKE